MGFDGIFVPPPRKQSASPSLRSRAAFSFSKRVGLSTPTVLIGSSFIFIFLLIAYNAGNSVVEELDDGAAIFLRGEEDLYDLFASLNASQRCIDDEDPPQWNTAAQNDEPCECPDPTVARKRRSKEWRSYHENMVQRAKKVQRKGLDVLFLGDSITERWMGTKALGKSQKPDFRNVFEAYFRKSKGGALDGEAFGTGGDTTTELLWHLKHGLLPKNIQPRAILLLIGTNDLGISFCSKKNALAGILNVATYIHKQRPDAQLIIHGLTPRNELYGDKNLDVGPRWEQIKWINTHLHTYTALQDDWFYVESPEIFLRKDDPTMINATLMKDVLHPTVQGYKEWAPRLSKQIQEILAMKNRRKSRL